MILDIKSFIEKEKPFWQELEDMLETLSRGGIKNFGLEKVKRFYYLYERVSEDLVKISTFSGEREVRTYLEELVSQSYAHIHGGRQTFKRPKPAQWLWVTLPTTFRRHYKAFWVAFLVTMIGTLFGGFGVAFDKDAKSAIFPQQFAHLQMSPEERVAMEENTKHDRMEGHKNKFAAFLMTNNIKVSINMLAFGMTFGIGTILMLFYNGVILGAVAVDFILGGQTTFLAGWLLPHGSVEIPAVLIAAQAGLVLGNSLLRPGNRSRSESLRANAPDMITLIIGVALLLVWAGVVESFFSQYHEPFIPYAVKIAFGSIQLGILIVYLMYAGKRKERQTV